MNSFFNWRDMLRFDKMIAPTFLTILYYLHTGVSILASLWFINKGMGSMYGGGAMVLLGLAGLLISPFFIRLFYEILIVIFKIHTRLTHIDYTLSSQTATTAADGPTPAPAPAAETPGSPAPTPFPPAYPTAGPAAVAPPMPDFWT